MNFGGKAKNEGTVRERGGQGSGGNRIWGRLKIAEGKVLLNRENTTMKN